MVENTWTATTNTDWIFFDSEHTLTSTTGNNGDEIIVYVEEPSEPTTDVNGTIEIRTNKSIIVKEIKRCNPSVVSASNSFDFNIYYGGDVSSVVGPCVDGSSSDVPGGISIRDIVLTSTITYSNGNVETTEISLTDSDIIVYYLLPPNEMEYEYLPPNDGAERDVSIKIVLKENHKVYDIKNNAFKQQGIIDDSGDYIVKEGSTGYSKQIIEYRGFDIADENKGQNSESCHEGTYTFNVVGQKVTILGVKTGLTDCDDVVYLDGGTEESEDISVNDVTFSVVTPSELTDFAHFNGNVLSYSENNTRTDDIQLSITATLNDENVVNTTYTVIHGSDCGEALYIHSSLSSTNVQYTGGNVTFRYYLSNSEDDDESLAIKDIDILSNLKFVCPQGVQNCGIPSLTNGVYSRTVSFFKNQKNDGEDGILWKFVISHDDADNSPKEVNIYQANKYENLIPNCDYFVFKYNWENTDGTDLDSLTHITNVPTLTSHDINVSALTVGYGGTSIDSVTHQYEGKRILLRCVNGEDGLLYLRHGGDNICSGAEGAIVCLKNILKSNQVSFDDTIYIDIYADWFGRRDNGYMSISYNQYSGLTEDGTYSDEIKEIVNDNCGDNYYYTFEPVEGNCIAVTNEQTISGIQVNANGSKNSGIAKNIDCINGAYTHVLRLAYNVAAGSLSLRSDFDDVGIDTVHSNRKFYVNGNVYTSLSYIKYTASTSGEHVVYDNVYATYDYGGTTHKVNIFTDEEGHNGTDDSLELYEKIEPFESYIYKKEDLGHGINLSFIHNFTVTKNNDNTVRVEFDIDESMTDREFDIKPMLAINYGLDCSQENTGFNYFEIYQKIN